MYKILFALSCVTSVGHGQQASHLVQHESLSKALAEVLLAFNPGANVPQGDQSAGLTTGRSKAFARTSAASLSAQPKEHVVAVCKHKMCKKDGSEETIATMKALASTHRGIAEMKGAAGEKAEQFQRKFADRFVESSHCYGSCGSGPNVMDTNTGRMFKDVYKPATAAAVLEVALGLDIPDKAVEAWVDSMKAKRALEDGEKTLALFYLNEALAKAAWLRINGARLLHLLLESRAHVLDLLGHEEAAIKDRTRSIRMLQRKYRKSALRLSPDALKRVAEAKDAATAFEARAEARKQKRIKIRSLLR